MNRGRAARTRLIAGADKARAAAGALLTAIVSVVVGCTGTLPAPQHRPAAEPPQRLEERLQAMAQKYPVDEDPQRDPVQIRAQIAALEERRQALLLRYTPAHPAVVQLDRQLRILRERLSAAEAQRPSVP
ncbi:MAG: hypothetical protein N2Z63_10095 [Thiobacillaceae bacterium]|nr:hypothetical protein [Thiobacillaceae bacterium]MDW8322468.1 hypothetical protein [Burkholderiales bacterium]